MYAQLTSIEMLESTRLRGELRRFFGRVRLLYDTLDRPCYNLNRLQRRRCRHNLMQLKRLEYEFNALTYDNDVYELYRLVQQYVLLDEAMLTQALAHRHVKIPSLFIC